MLLTDLHSIATLGFRPEYKRTNKGRAGNRASYQKKKKKATDQDEVERNKYENEPIITDSLSESRTDHEILGNSGSTMGLRVE